jgi:hypothetical protein
MATKNINKKSLTNNDYKSILKFYNKSISKSIRMNKKNAEQILATKLCRCIKSVGTFDETKALRICTSKIFQNKKLRRGKFTCKKRQHVNITK